LDWAALQKGILSSLNSSHYHLIVGQPCTSAAAQRMFLERALLEQATAGVLLCAAEATLSLSFLEALAHRGKPIVFVGLPPPEGMESDLVGTNNKGAASELVRHLIAQGHRSIAHLTLFDGTAIQERLIGYRQALKEAGIPFRPELVISGATDYQGHILDRGDMLHRLLSLPAPPSALFAVNDALALEAIHALRASGVRVPEDMAVAGFGGSQQRETDSSFLTTAVHPWERIGQEAAELLMRRMESGPPVHYQRILLDAPLSIRGSTRPLR
jgi:DNA-binding LacI/PurR family transcriptional regulator